MAGGEGNADEVRKVKYTETRKRHRGNSIRDFA